MTTVINLNFFRFSLNKSIFDDFCLNKWFSDRRDNFFSREDRVIDITSQSRVFEDDENNIEHGFSESCKTRRLADPSLINITYDSKGNIVQFFHSKGIHVDSYA